MPRKVPSRIRYRFHVELAVACALLSACGGDTSAPARAPAAITVVSGGSQTADVGAAFAEPVTFKVTDAGGAGVKGVVVTFAVSTGAAMLNPAAGTTDDQGLAQTTVTAGNTPGPIVIEARAGNLAQTATASLAVQVGVAAGQWEGSTGQNLPIFMRVSGRTIDTLTVRLTATYGRSTCTGTVIKTGIAISVDGSFETTLGIGFQAPFRGRFTSPTSATGTIEEYSGSFAAVCGTTIILGTGSPLARVTWEGRKR